MDAFNTPHPYKQEPFLVAEAWKCNHTWKDDNYFSARVYTTCIHCGAKKEEAQEVFNDSDCPF